MGDEDKTREQLIDELARLRQRIVELEVSETEHKRAREMLSKSEEELRRLFESITDGITVTDLNGVITDANERVLELGGFGSKSDVIGKSAIESIVPRDRERALRDMQELVLNKTVNSSEYSLLRVDGSEYPAEISAGVLTDAAGDAVGFVSIIRDITERKQAKEALRESENKYKTLVENIPQKIVLKNRDLVFVSCNRNFARDFKAKPEELIGKTDYDLFQKDLAKNYMEDDTRIIKSGKIESIEQRYIQDGQERTVQTFKAPVRGDKGDVTGVLSIFHDITEHKQMERRIQHLNLVLYAIRNVNQIIAREKNRDRLLKRICDNLVESCGYYNAWIAILDESGNLVTTAEAGLGSKFSLMVERLKHGEFTNCARRTLKQSDIVFIENPPSTCGDCPLAESYQGRGAMTIRLEHSGKVYGILSVSIPVEFTANKEEQDLFKEVAQDIALALHNIDMEEKRKQVEEALLESESKYRTLVENIPQKIFLKNKDLVWISCNENIARDFKAKTEELVGKTDYDLFPKELAEKYRTDDRRVIKSGETESIEESYIQDGQEITVQTFKAPVRDEKGDVTGVLGIFHDITERKRGEHNLQERIKELQCLYGIAEVAERPGITLDELYQEVVNLLPSSWQYPEITYTRIIIDNKKFKTNNCRDTQWQQSSDIKVYGAKAGTLEVGYIELRPELDEGPFLKEERQLIGAVAKQLGRITERKQVEEALLESESKYRTLVENIPQKIFLKNKDLVWISCNENIARDFKAKPEELVGKTDYDFFPKKLAEKYRADDRRVIKSGETESIEESYIHDGQEITVQTFKAPVRDEKGDVTGILGIFHDITERKQMEEVLQRERDKAQKYLDIAGVILVVCGADQRVSLINRRGCDILECGEGEIIGKNWTDNFIPKRFRDKVKNVFNKLIAGEVDPVEYVENPVLPKDGEERIIAWHNSVIKDEAGNIISVLSSGEDITERKRMEAEKKEMEQKAQLASRLASIGEMAAGVAHEINNPLTGVIGFAQLLMQKNIPDDIKEQVRIINDGAKRVAAIVNRLLTFARRYKPEREYIDINAIIEATLELRAYEMETANIKVNTRLAPDLPLTVADGGQLQQVFLNIIVNAETEMELAHGRGNLLIATEMIDSTIRISFEDDGPGIAKENLGKIFDPFFTTREVGGGTGLGLSLCHGVIAEHNGYIYARSQLGRGATFIVELPIVLEEKQLELPEPTADRTEKVAGARILVVDDEPAILKFLEWVLVDEGHEVETTDSAENALAKISSGQYNLILLDIKLPGMSGIELYKRIQEMADSLASRVIFITGDTIGADTRDFLSMTRAHYITKPINIEQLKREINSQVYGSA